ncbi:hypothetical protein N9Z27_02855 [Alphaproteobacteria bacterium]|nr:hypothetical protein [Alphaproteobacteria bacterium]
MSLKKYFSMGRGTAVLLAGSVLFNVAALNSSRQSRGLPLKLKPDLSVLPEEYDPNSGYEGEILPIPPVVSEGEPQEGFSGVYHAPSRLRDSKDGEQSFLGLPEGVTNPVYRVDVAPALPFAAGDEGLEGPDYTLVPRTVPDEFRDDSFSDDLRGRSVYEPRGFE